MPEREPRGTCQRPRHPGQQRSEQMQHQRQADEPHAHAQANPDRRRLPRRQRHQRAAHEHGGGDLEPVAAMREGILAQQQRRLHLPHLEQRHHGKQQRHQHADAHALRHGRSREPVGDRQRADLIHVGGDQRDGERGQADADHAAERPERERLKQIHRENLAAGAAHALHHRDALDLLPDEHARHARHGDAAQHHDHEPDQAEIVFRAARSPRRSAPGGPDTTGRARTAGAAPRSTGSRAARRTPQGAAAASAARRGCRIPAARWPAGPRNRSGPWDRG